MKLRRFDERQKLAGGIAVGGCIVGAILILVGGLVVTVMLYAANTVGLTNIADIHKTVWGFLTSYTTYPATYYKDGSVATSAQTVAGVNGGPLVWIAGWITAWCLYELCEGIAWPIRVFARISKGEPQQEVDKVSRHHPVDF